MGGIYVRLRGCFRVRGSVRCEVWARGGFRVRGKVRGRVRGREGLGLGISLWIHEKNKCTTPVSSYMNLPHRLRSHKIMKGDAEIFAVLAFASWSYVP